jgi:radical SAM protein (TIGR01212 family)
MDFRKSWNWYIEMFGIDVKILEDDTVAERMLPYTGGKPHQRHACIAVNLQGGGGFEIWQYSRRTPVPCPFTISVGDLGIFAAKLKCRDVAAFYNTLSQKWPDSLHIAYFQDFSNTYAPVDRLRELYYEALSMPDVVGLSIATRADCLEDYVCELLYEIGKKTYLTVELGLQSSSDVTAERINRGHSWAEFLQGYEKLRGLNVCVHIINGLPGENKDDMLKTACDVARLCPHEIKIHLLHVLKNTVMAEEYERGEFETLTLDEYADIVVSQLELLPPDTVIGRVTGDGLSDELIAPLWSTRKFNVMNTIDKLMVERDTYQGKLYNLPI